MSFNLDGIELGKLKALWPIIWPKLSSKASETLKPHMELIISNQNDDVQLVTLTNAIQSCCEHKPTNFEEYVAYVMIASSIELFSVPSALFRMEKSRLMAHTFNTYNEYWGHDEDKVMAVAEAIWKVSSSASNINHIIIAIHGYNQFTFNVSIVLLHAALGNLTIKTTSNRLPLLKADAVFKKLQSLDIINDQSDKKIMFNFLSLFQSYQRLMCLAATNDTSLSDILAFEPVQLKQMENCLKKATQSLNKTIRDQKDLNENPLIVHFIELVLNNMNSVHSKAGVAQ